MLCKLCKKNHATVHLTQIVGDKMQTADLCEDCAKTRDLQDPARFQDLLSGPDTLEKIDLAGAPNQPDLNEPASPTWPRWVAGMLLGDIVMGLLYAAPNALSTTWSSTPLAVPSFFLVPVVSGIIASYIWRTLDNSLRYVILNTMWMTIIALAVATLFLHEGVICLLIVSPILYLMLLTGAMLGRLLFGSKPTRLHLMILPSLAFVALAEPTTRVDHESVIVDQVVIKAPPAKVWKEITSFPAIPQPPKFWLFRLGLPYPVATTVEGDFVNADRRCIFSANAVFKERVAEIKPLEKLTFDIIESPRDPELLGHLDAKRGQFLLQPNAGGTTTLIGSTWYTLHIRPLWYFDLWTKHIFGAVHQRVMQDVKRRAEL